MIDVTTLIREFNGDPIPLDPDGSDGTDGPDRSMTVRSVAGVVLASNLGDSKDPGRALARFKLALRIYDEDEIELTTDEISDILALTLQGYNPLIYGRMVEAMDPVRLKPR